MTNTFHNVFDTRDTLPTIPSTGKDCSWCKLAEISFEEQSFLFYFKAARSSFATAQGILLQGMGRGAHRLLPQRHDGHGPHCCCYRYFYPYPYPLHSCGSLCCLCCSPGMTLSSISPSMDRQPTRGRTLPPTPRPYAFPLEPLESSRARWHSCPQSQTHSPKGPGVEQPSGCRSRERLASESGVHRGLHTGSGPYSTNVLALIISPRHF